MAWRELRAVLLLLVVTANLIQAIPNPRISEEDIEDPDWQSADIARWQALLGPLGISRDAQWLGDTVKGIVWRYKSVVLMLRKPASPVFQATQTNQQWGLFAVVTQAPDVLVVEVRREGEWSELYRRLDPEHAWNDRALKYRRLRGVWDGVKDEPKGTYKRFSVWLAKRIFAQEPQVDRVRVVLEKRRLTLPWDEPDLETTRRAERYHKRGNHMP